MAYVGPRAERREIVQERACCSEVLTPIEGSFEVHIPLSGVHISFYGGSCRPIYWGLHGEYDTYFLWVGGDCSLLGQKPVAETARIGPLFMAL